MSDTRMDFCTNCRKETPYHVCSKPVTETIREKKYDFFVTTATCDNCGCEMSLPGLIDLNVAEIDSQYREVEHLVTIHDIKQLMALYDIGKAPLSLVLGFGEITITRYLSGQVPSKEYSEIIQHAMSSPSYMREMLESNKAKITETAYRKCVTAIEKIQSMFSNISDAMLASISCLFESMAEITPLSLQKLLYFIQGIHLAKYSKPLFVEDCEAWVHGPVYPSVYHLFQNFKYNAIDDSLYCVLKEKQDLLPESAKEIIGLVISTFGAFGGKTLEAITHKESPWAEARKNSGFMESFSETISKQSIIDYFQAVDRKYDLSSEDEISKYIHSLLHK